MKRHKLRFAEFSASHVGKPYKLGQHDCLTLSLDLCAQAGIPVPGSFRFWHAGEGRSGAWICEEVTREGYAALYLEDPERAKGIFLRWVESVGLEIPAVQAFTGDILVCRRKEAFRKSPLSGEPLGPEPLSILIHAGGDRVMGAFESRGVDLCPIRGYDILHAYRIRKRHSRRMQHAPAKAGGGNPGGVI